MPSQKDPCGCCNSYYSKVPSRTDQSSRMMTLCMLPTFGTIKCMIQKLTNHDVVKNTSTHMLKHQCTYCGKMYGNARGLAAHRSCNIKCSHDFGTTLRSSLSAPQNTAFGAQNHAFGQDASTMTSRCRGAVESHFDIANKGDDIFGFTLDPVHVGGDEKGFQDSVPAMDLGLSIKPNNQHISGSGEVLYTQANTMKIKLLKLCHQAEAPLYLFESILQWAAEAANTGVSFSPAGQSCDNYLKELCSRFKMENLRPIQRSLLLADGATNKHVSCFSFLDQFRSLLDNQWLMTQENCLFSFTDPCALQVDTGAIGDLNQSRFWHETQMAECTLV